MIYIDHIQILYRIVRSRDTKLIFVKISSIRENDKVKLVKFEKRYPPRSPRTHMCLNVCVGGG